MDSFHSASNASQNTGIPSANSNNGKKRRKLKRMISSSDSDEDIIEFRTPTRPNPNEERRASERPNSNGSDAIRTPKTVKTPNSRIKELSDKRDNSFEREKLSESRDEIRLKKEVLANLNSLQYFYATSQELKTSIQLQLNTNLDQYIGCIKPTQTHGDLTKFSNLKMFKALKNYQQCGVHWLSVVHEVPYASAILADEMGLGKTAQVCVFLEYIYRIHGTSVTPNTSSNSYNVTPPSRTSVSDGSKGSPAIDPPLSTSPISTSSNLESNNSNSENDVPGAENVVTPSSVYTITEGSTPTAKRPGITIIIVPLSVMNNWLREFETWTNLGPKVVIFHGNYKERMELLESILERIYNNEIYIIIMTLGMFKEMKILKHHEPFEYLIIDEAHSIKNPNTTMYRKLLYSLEFRHKLLLTGTPIQNTMDELCSLLQFAMPYSFESSKINHAIDTMINDPEYIYSIYENHELLDELLGRSQGATEGSDSGKNAESRDRGEAESDTRLKTAEVDSGGTGELGVGTLVDSGLTDSTSVGNTTDISTTSSSQGAMKSEQLADSQEAVGKIKTELYTCINDIIERNMNKMEISEHLKIIQKLTTPFILRRLKRNVMNELPTKNSVYVPCEMVGVQLDMYHRFFTSRTLNTVVLTGVSNAAASRAGDSDDGENSCTDSDDTKYDMDNLDSPLNNLDKEVMKPVKGSSTEKMTYKIFQLRRICNHPLLVRGLYYTEDQMHEIAKIVVKAQSALASRDNNRGKDKGQGQSKGKKPDKNKSSQKGNNDEKKRNREQELEKMKQYLLSLSDFEIYNLYLSNVGRAGTDSELGPSEEQEAEPVVKIGVKSGVKTLESPSKKKEDKMASTSGTSTSTGDNIIRGDKDGKEGSGGGSGSGTGEGNKNLSGNDGNGTSEGNASGEGNASSEANASSEGTASISVTKSTGNIGTARDHTDSLISGSLTLGIGSQSDRNPYLIEEHLFFESAKINKMFDLLRLILNRKENVLIFSQFTSYLDIIEKCFELRGIVNYLRLDGSLNVKQKEEILTLFSSTSREAKDKAELREKAAETEGLAPPLNAIGASRGLTRADATVDTGAGMSTSRTTESSVSARARLDTGYRIMLISTKVGGIGLNLTRANNVILMDQSWNPHNDLQAEDRAHRIGQDKPVNIYKLFTRNTIEEHVIFKSTNKLYLNQLFNEA
ncbi:DEAD-box family helicase [Theileria orientalis]|uniref:DEAD-box family helicase n=1 Tax=Theileria orientalis TaxID=68886 RepID=A0A976M7Z1_THEOR|nr:DEAD-box family helicase [Theileria orientalis]